MKKNNFSNEQIIEILKSLGASEYQDYDNYIKFRTICHHNDEKEGGYNLIYFKDSGSFYCFSHCGFLSLEKLLNKKGIYDYSKWANKNGLKIDFLSLNKEIYRPQCHIYKEKKEIPSLPEYKDYILNVFSFYYPIEWKRDNISEEAMKEYNIKYSIVDNSIIIPHYDVNNRLVGIRKRTLNPEEEINGKYKPIFIDNKSYAHPLGYNLYGLNKIIENVNKKGKIIIAEGEKSALQSFSFFGKEENIVCASCGSNLSIWQIKIILKYSCPNEIILAFDQGISFNKKYNICRKYKNYCNMSFIDDPKGTFLNNKESPLDNPKNLEELIYRRIKVG